MARYVHGRKHVRRELFDIIVKGKGKMEGEGDRIKAEMAWKLVNYVRTLAKKGPVAKLGQWLQTRA